MVEQMQVHHGEQPGAVHAPIRTYLTVWGWLFVLSAIAYFVDVVHLVGWLKVILLSLLALMKAGLIMAFFMHLRFERLSLVYAIVAPIIFLVVMLVGLLPDGISVFLRR
ncbi:MAG: cytochrome C oxidase subunit IV family protein [Candidatus Kapabacteria bacterium]|nr:cytochrome C oxidase subunit IV family protein [Candidatus Kapabacteria bacterium]MDW8011973.1 cytochrome C oxidase subunit IV family protein [Bacteroidota bacterium]